MAVRDIFKISRKTFFNPMAWLDANRIIDSSKTILATVRDLFVVPTPLVIETFEEAMERQGLTEEDVAVAKKNYYIYAILFLILAALTLIFTFYLLIAYHTLPGFILGIGTTGLFLGQAFRFHFWYFQIKHRKLGCTFDEWRSGKIKESNP